VKKDDKKDGKPIIGGKKRGRQGPHRIGRPQTEQSKDERPRSKTPSADVNRSTGGAPAGKHGKHAKKKAAKRKQMKKKHVSTNNRNPTKFKKISNK
jgi:hypothetical protein